MPVVVAQLGWLAPGLSLPPMVSQLFSLPPALVMPTVPVVVTPLPIIQVDPVLSASSGEAVSTGDQVFPGSGVVPLLSSHQRTVVEPLFHDLDFCVVSLDGDQQQDSSVCVQVLSLSGSVLVAVDQCFL